MRQLSLVILAVLLFSSSALAQRDAPVWSSYLPSITLFDERSTLDFDLLFCKCGGPHEHTEHQMYVLGYLEKDEAKILELAADKKLTNKKQKDAKLLLEVLEEQQLAVVLDVKLAKREEVKPDESGKRRSPLRGGYFFEYSFSFDNSSLFKTIGKLKHFNPKDFFDSDHRYYNDKFKLMIFVPVNDSKYATKVSKELRTTHDFAHFGDQETILLYFKPLPYRFQFKPLDEEGIVVIYVD